MGDKEREDKWNGKCAGKEDKEREKKEKGGYRRRIRENIKKN